MLKRYLTIGAAFFVVSACGDTPMDPGIDAHRQTAVLASGFAPADRISICHLDADLGTYSLLGINGNAEAAHRAHGDGQVWDPIPGLEGYVFDEGCAPLEGGRMPVGAITATIYRGGNPPGTDRGVESSAVNLVADAQLWASLANGAQIAFMNPGGVRSDLTYPQSGGEGDGVVTLGEAFTFQPFGNTLVTFPMTGAQIISVLEEQCQPAGSSRTFLHLGVSEGFSYDLAKTIVGGECTSITIGNVRLNGTLLNPADTYLVTANNFLADGGDGFGTFATITAPRLDGGNDLEALINYLGAFSPVSPPATDRVNELN